MHGSTLNLRVAALTHVGRRRYTNEDCIAIGEHVLNAPIDVPWVATIALSEPAVCLVADGMGGHPAGDVASRLVVERLSTTLPGLLTTDAALIEEIRQANRMLFDAMREDPAHSGMGTTLAGFAVSAHDISLFNVGDSRIYRVDGGAIAQLSVDDSESTASALLSWAFPSRVLVQCLGGYPGSEEINPHVVREPVAVGYTCLVCSDGLHDMLNDREIEACLQEDLESSVSALFQSAMHAGGSDNISIILARIEAEA